MVHNLHLSDNKYCQTKELNLINIKLLNRESHIDRSSTKKAPKIQRRGTLANVLPLLLLVLKVALSDSISNEASFVDSHSENIAYLSRCGDVFCTIVEAKNDNIRNALVLITILKEKADNNKTQSGCEQAHRSEVPMTTALVPMYRRHDQCMERTEKMNDPFKLWRRIVKEWQQPSNYVKRNILRKFIRQMERRPGSLGKTLGSSVVHLHPILDLRVHYNISRGSLHTLIEVVPHQEESYWPTEFTKISNAELLDTSAWLITPIMENDLITFLDEMVKNVIEVFSEYLFSNIIRIPIVEMNSRPLRLASEDSQHSLIYNSILTLGKFLCGHYSQSLFYICTSSWSPTIRHGLWQRGQTPVASSLTENFIHNVSQGQQEIYSTPLTETDPSLSIPITESEAGQNLSHLHLIQHAWNPTGTTIVPLMETSLSIPFMEAGANHNVHHLHVTQHQLNLSEVSLPVMETSVTLWTTAIAETGINNSNDICQNPSVSSEILYFREIELANLHYTEAIEETANQVNLEQNISISILEIYSGPVTPAIAETGSDHIQDNPSVSSEILYLREIELANLHYNAAIEETANQVNLEQNTFISILEIYSGPVTPAIAETGSDHMQDNPLIALQVNIFHHMHADSEAAEEVGEADIG